MGLMNPTPGELLDRQTILHLKIDAGRRRRVGVSHFEEELRMIEAALAEWFSKNPGADRSAFDAVAKELADVNGKLWNAEDEVRALSPRARDRLAEFAKLIPQLNDLRADLVQRVNRLFRVGHPDKLYR